MTEPLWAGRYRRDRMLGRGAMGEVWAAHDVVLDRTVAIKSIAPGLVQAADLERMTREARVAARIAHPNAVGVFDLVTVDGRPNLVMEFVDGTTLDELIAERGRLDVRDVERVGAAIAAALAEAHRLGVVHRDIKPANILITSRGVPKLADFGISRGVGDASVTATGATIGTPAYLAPEIVQGAAADPRSDVWALGVTLYAALEGSSPFVLSRHDDPLVVLGRVLTAPVRPTAVGGPLGAAISAMLDRDPARRPTAEKVSAMLRRSGSDGDAVAAGVGAADGVDPRFTSASDTTRLAVNRPELPFAAATGQSGAAGRAQRKSRRRYLLVAATVLVLVGGGTTALLLPDHAHRGHVAEGAQHPSTGSGPPSTDSSSGRPPPGRPTSSAPLVGAESGKTYRGPSGIEVTGPPGWTRDRTETNPRLADYLAPGTTQRQRGLYFRLGTNDRHAASDIEATAANESAFVLDPHKSQLTDPAVVSTTYVRFLGLRAVDIEWTGINTDGVHRHAIERLWNAGGITREITVNAGPGKVDVARAVFRELVASCRVNA